MKALLVLIAFVTAAAPAVAQRRAYLPYSGRWDLTVETPSGSYPSWLEVSDRDGTVTVVVVGKNGGLHGSDHVRLEVIPVSTVPGLNESAVVMGDKTVASRLAFTTMETFDKPVSVEWTIESAGNKVTGHQKRSDGVEGNITGEHSPALKRKAPAQWSAPEPLFNGKDLSGWEPDTAGANHWKAEDGTLTNVTAGATSVPPASSTTLSCMWSSTARAAATAVSFFAGATNFKSSTPLQSPSRHRKRSVRFMAFWRLR